MPENTVDGMRVSKGTRIVTILSAILFLVVFVPVVPLSIANHGSSTTQTVLASAALTAPTINSTGDQCDSPCHTCSSSVQLAVAQDPSGTYCFKYLGNGTYATDLATYERILQDPYSGIGGQVDIVGDVVYITMPQISPIDVVGGPILEGLILEQNSTQPSAMHPTSGLGSLTYLISGLGGLLLNGNYLLKP